MPVRARPKMGVRKHMTIESLNASRSSLAASGDRSASDAC